MYIEPKWVIDITIGTISHFKGGNYESLVQLQEDDYDIVIPQYYIPELIQLLTEKGYIKPQMSKESREEDIKIIHRLLDVVEKKK